MIFNIDSAIKHSYSNDDTCFSIDVIDEILEEDFDALLDEGSKILHSIEGTILEEEIFSEFDKLIAMTADEIYNFESDTEEPPFEKITINTDYKIKTSLEEPPTDLKLKPLPDNLEYVFLEEPSFLPVIKSSKLSAQNKSKLVSILKNISKPLLGKQQTFLNELIPLIGFETGEEDVNREIITSQLQGKLWLYDEVSARLSGGEYVDSGRSPLEDKDKALIPLVDPNE
ncbi:hypothetical protein Tco_0407158 [Tanacetum coccineum]